MMTTLEQQLSSIEKLTWLPWVGSSYQQSNSKILIIGESHYDGNPNTYAQTMSNPTFTREILLKYGIGDDTKGTKFFGNIQKVMQGANQTKPSEFWKSVAFYNFIQRAMENPKWRPTSGDFNQAWKLLPNVLNVLKPDFCLFTGLSATYQIGDLLELKEHNWSDWTCGEKIGRSKGRHTTLIDRDGHTTKLVFIRHPSAYFSPAKWHPYVATMIQPNG